ncbi:MAG: LuxR C-terminal-related transcriptional regulator, partial [Chloroflexota bacterium]
PERTGLVLDDAHLLSDAGALALLDELLRYPSPTMRLVLTARDMHGMDLAHMHARGRASIIDAEALRFTPVEAESFLALHAMAPDASTDLLEGWPAGLRLVTLASTAAGEESHSPHRLSTRLLIAEVIGAMEDADRDLLTAAAIPERFTGELCTAMLGQPDQIGQIEDAIQRIAESNAFLTPMDGERRWWRFHAIMRDALLTGGATARGTRGIADLRSRAAGWLAEHGDVHEAARRLLAAGEIDAAVTLIEHHILPAIMAMRSREMAGWIALLPSSVVERRVLLQIGAVDRLVAGGASARVDATLDRVERMVDRGVGFPERMSDQTLRGIVLVYRSINAVLGSSDPARGLELATAASTHFTNGERYGLNSLMMSNVLLKAGHGDTKGAIAYLEGLAAQDDSPLDIVVANYPYFLAITHLLDGDYQRAITQADHLQHLAIEAGFATRVLDSAVCLGTALYALNRLEEAEAAYLDAQSSEHFEGAHIFSVQESTFGMALVLQATGRSAEARATIDRYLRTLNRTGQRALMELARSFRLRLAVLQGDIDRAMTELGTLGTSFRQPVSLIEHLPVTRARILARWGTEESCSEALALCDALLAPQAAALGHGVRVEARITQALAYLNRENEKGALASLAAALELSRENGAIRPFVDAGPMLLPLYETFAESGDEEAARILQWHALSPAYVPNPFLTLSRRERQVLEAMRRGLTNKEIGDELFISPHTVKRHAQTIFRKLGVSNRDAAVAAASAQPA